MPVAHDHAYVHPPSDVTEKALAHPLLPDNAKNTTRLGISWNLWRSLCSSVSFKSRGWTKGRQSRMAGGSFLPPFWEHSGELASMSESDQCGNAGATLWISGLLSIFSSSSFSHYIVTYLQLSHGPKHM